MNYFLSCCSLGIVAILAMMAIVAGMAAGTVICVFSVAAGLHKLTIQYYLPAGS